ncbi:MAG: ATP-binding domain-containing protein, partial [Lachnospiraceae bacterium]|nr:ATP-binding domain-containing protein [Lachnospiraceae bacterium]
RIENIRELLNRMQTFENEHAGATLSEFLEDVALVSDLDSADEQVSRVLLMTVHSAKGLEFPRVWLCGMEDGIFPSYMTINSENTEDEEEERRLAYVAITRAKDVLCISAARSRMVRGETQCNAVSRFVEEIPEEYLEGEVPKGYGSRMDFDDDGWSSVSSRNSFGGGGFGKSTYGKNSSARMFFKEMPFSKDEIPERGFIPPKKKKEAPAKPAETVLVKGGDLQIEEPDYVVGDRVLHIKFGEGEVLALEKGPRDYQVTVRFDTVGQKVMYAKFAKLQKI